MGREDCFHLGIKAIVRRNAGEILMLKVNVNQLRDYDGDAYWDIPGGRMQQNDTIEQALRREVWEETGIPEIRGFEFFSAALSNIRIPIGHSRSVGLILFIYVCDVGDVNKIKLSSEHVDFAWFAPCQAADLLEVKYPREFVDKLRAL